jgi:NADPH:quinone reductase-like Zn-dependent oxidoreductase
MRVAEQHRYGPPEVVTIAERPDPVATRNKVVVRIESVAVTSADARIRAARFPRGFAFPARLVFGLFRPRRTVLGAAIAGTVAEVGPGASVVQPGQRVCAMLGLGMAGHAELVAVDPRRLVPVPDDVSLDDAAGVLFGGTTALTYVRDKVKVRPGWSVLVIGAAGAVGSNTVQLAALAGADVTGVASAANADLVVSLGAKRVIDYTTTPLDSLDEQFDAVIDTVGVLTITTGKRLLAPGGVLALVVAGLADTIRARGNVVAGPASEKVEHITELVRLVASDDLQVVIDDVMPLDRIVDAHRRVDSGHKLGNLIIHPNE